MLFSNKFVEEGGGASNGHSFLVICIIVMIDTKIGSESLTKLFIWRALCHETTNAFATF